MKSVRFNIVLCFCVLALAANFLFVNYAMADESNLDLGYYDYATFEKINSNVDIAPENFFSVVKMVLVDLGGDGQKEVLVSRGGNGARPELFLYRFDGSLINSWQPYPDGFRGEINIVAGDLNNDGKDEMVTVPGAGGGPQVMIFNGFGQLSLVKTFWAGEKSYRNGSEVAIGDVDGDRKNEIIISYLIDGKNGIKFFNMDGQESGPGVLIDLANNFEPAKVGAMDIETDGQEEIFVGLGSGNAPELQILRRDGSLVNKFNAYNKDFLGGFNFYLDKKEKTIVTGAGYSGRAHVRFFNVIGKSIKKEGFFVYPFEFTGGVNVAVGDVTGDKSDELVVLPQYYRATKNYKSIDIDISEQQLRYYQSGKLVGTFIVSSGLPSMPTPFGEFAIFQKNPRAYSAPYKLYMPWWMSFKPKYGLHELPEWANGYKEGANHLGKPVSHGCVRLGVGAAKTLYDWAPLGTPVIIHE